MARFIASALIVDNGERVLLRLNGDIYEFTQYSLRQLLGLPRGRPGLGITTESDSSLLRMARSSI
jgi:hypothetical protein